MEPERLFERPRTTTRRRDPLVKQPQTNRKVKPGPDNPDVRMAAHVRSAHAGSTEGVTLVYAPQADAWSCLTCSIERNSS